MNINEVLVKENIGKLYKIKDKNTTWRVAEYNDNYLTLENADLTDDSEELIDDRFILDAILHYEFEEFNLPVILPKGDYFLYRAMLRICSTSGCNMCPLHFYESEEDEDKGVDYCDKIYRYFKENYSLSIDKNDPEVLCRE